MKKEIKTCIGFTAILTVCLFTEPMMDRMEARAAVVEPEPSVAVTVEIQRVELPAEEEKPAESAPEREERLVNNTPLTDEEYQVLLETCERCNVAPSLALGLIEVESHFQPDAVSRCGARGYCQLLPKYFGVLTPVENIRAGIEYLVYQCERYGSTESGLTAFNAGHDTGDTTYARAVLRAAEKWEEVG